MTEQELQEMQELIDYIFGEIKSPVDNGSDGIDDDEFVQWASAEEAELYA